MTIDDLAKLVGGFSMYQRGILAAAAIVWMGACLVAAVWSNGLLIRALGTSDSQYRKTWRTLVVFWSIVMVISAGLLMLALAYCVGAVLFSLSHQGFRPLATGVVLLACTVTSIVGPVLELRPKNRT